MPTFLGMASIISTGLVGVQQGLSAAARDASMVQEAFSTGADPTGGMVALKRDEHLVQASAKLIRIGDDLNGTILDILA